MKVRKWLTGSIMLAVGISGIAMGDSLLFDSALSDNGGLFESSISGREESGNESNTSNYRLNGLLKTGVFMDKEADDVQDTYAIGEFKVEVDKGDFGRAYANIKVNSTKDETEFTLKEGYIDVYKDKWDFRIGNQIVVWGRADGINPTDNLNSKDMTLYTFDEDDSRTANFMAKATYNFYPLSLDAIYVPSYKATQAPIPYSYTSYDDKGAVAFKLNYENPKIDGSVSYYSGYSKMPGITMEGYTSYLKPYKQDVIGADFATTFGKYGFRNEFAYKHTEDYKENSYIPNPEIDYVVGIDRELVKDLSLILQYSVKYIVDYEEAINAIEAKNSIISQQTKEVQNSIIYRLSWELMYETLHLENLTNYNLDTKELFTRVKGEYDITDSFLFTLGADFYSGDDNTLMGMIEDVKTAVYMGVKVEF